MRTLKVKCPTWKHVEAFYKRKLRRDKTLTIRVPFNPAEGSALSVRLQLPDGSDMEIPGKVMGVLPDGTGSQAAITLHLHGFTEAIESSLREAVKLNKLEPSKPAVVVPSQVATSGSGGHAAPRDGVPAQQPEDAPIDEPVSPPYEPTMEDISEFEREVFGQLQAELLQLREFAAHEIFGIAEDADVPSIRRAYFARTKFFHPDLFAKYHSEAIRYMAQEVFIHINRAYDRLREAAVREGRAVVAGPALLPHDGWLAGLDDMRSNESDDVNGLNGLGTTDARYNWNSSGASSAAAPRDDVQAQAEDLMIAGDLERARAVVAAALHSDPRNRELRALYYVIGGEQALVDGDKVLAASQFEAALAHDAECQPARAALDELRARGEHGGVHTKSLR